MSGSLAWALEVRVDKQGDRLDTGPFLLGRNHMRRG